MIEAYVDGAFGKNSKGYEIPTWAFIVLNDEEEKDIEYEEYGSGIPAEYFEHRNVGGEIYSVKKLIEFCQENDEKEVIIHNDYEGLEKWATGAWKANKELTKGYKEFLDQSHVIIKWDKVDAHTGNKWNEYVDSLCKKALTEDTTEPEEYVPLDNMEPPVEINYITDPPKDRTIREEFHIKTEKAGNRTEEEETSSPSEKVSKPLETETKEIPPMLKPINAQAQSNSGMYDGLLREAQDLCQNHKYMQASQLLSPYINENSDENVFKAYIDIILYMGDYYALKAVKCCEKYLPLHSEAIKVKKSYCYALFYAYIRPIVASAYFDAVKYNEAKAVIKKILSVSKHSTILNEFLFPFIEYAFRVGDKMYIKDLVKEIDINLFSKEKIKDGNRSFFSNYERVNYFIKGQG
ncbi:MAG: hypothetical protein IJS60_08070 [Abditibacteriota bacterium]|nr:hypothetical protein [Abditibacteriota bacterium]